MFTPYIKTTLTRTLKPYLFQVPKFIHNNVLIVINAHNCTPNKSWRFILFVLGYFLSVVRSQSLLFPLFSLLFFPSFSFSLSLFFSLFLCLEFSLSLSLQMFFLSFSSSTRFSQIPLRFVSSPSSLINRL